MEWVDWASRSAGSRSVGWVRVKMGRVGVSRSGLDRVTSGYQNDSLDPSDVHDQARTNVPTEPDFRGFDHARLFRLADLSCPFTDICFGQADFASAVFFLQR